MADNRVCPLSVTTHHCGLKSTELVGLTAADELRDDPDCVKPCGSARRDGDLLEVIPEIGLRERAECVIGGENAGCLTLPPVVLPQAFRDFRAWTIEAGIASAPRRLIP